MVESWVIGYMLYVIVLLGIVYGVSKLTQHRYKREWVEHGRRWRDKGYPRFDARYKWIQRYFDMGYDEPK